MKTYRVVAGVLSLLMLCALFACGAPALQDASTTEVPASPVPVQVLAHPEPAQEGYAQAHRYLAPEQSVEEYIYLALLAEKSEIDILDYEIPAAQISDLYTRVMNTHPDLFYVQPGISYTYTSSGLVVALKPSYYMTQEKRERADAYCAQRLDEICAGVDAQWSDFEIALYLHDYLCTNFSYDKTYRIYDMYGFLKEGTGVCQAYTLTYMALLARYGIKSDVAVSQSMNHIWNVVVLGGAAYHVDVTWDDPVPDASGRALHSNFLRSDAGIQSTEHYAWESDLTCSSNAYEATFVVDVDTPYAYTAGQWFFTDGKERAIFAADFSTMSATKFMEINEKWMTPEGNSYYLDAFCGVGTYRGNLIYNTPDRIMAYNLQSGVTVDLGISIPRTKQIYGLMVQGQEIVYRIADEPGADMEVLRYTISDLADYLWGDADQNGFVDGRDVTAIRRYLAGLPTVCHTGAADLDDNGRVDERDVEILRQYLVENNESSYHGG